MTKTFPESSKIISSFASILFVSSISCGNSESNEQIEILQYQQTRSSSFAKSIIQRQRRRMGNESTKMEIEISGEPFKPRDWIDGEVVVTTTKPLKDISGIDVRFEGGSWYAAPGDEIEREVYVDKSINLTVDGGQLKRRGQHRFAYSFHVPEGCKSSVVFSRFGWTKYNITASLQRKGVGVCSASRNLIILAQPMKPTEHDINYDNDPADGDKSDDEVAGEGSLIVWKDPDPRYNHLPGKCAAMELELSKRIFQPGDYIPIWATFHLDTKRAGPFDIKASIGFIIDRAAPTSPAAEAISGGRQNGIEAAPDEKWMGKICGDAPVNWPPYGGFFWLPSITPTESSLFYRFRNRRCLIIAMEQCKYPAGSKPKRLEVKLPIQIGN